MKILPNIVTLLLRIKTTQNGQSPLKLCQSGEIFTNIVTMLHRINTAQNLFKVLLVLVMVMASAYFVGTSEASKLVLKLFLLESLKTLIVLLLLLLLLMLLQLQMNSFVVANLVSEEI